MDRRYALPTAGVLTLLIAAALIPAMKSSIDNDLASDARAALAAGHLSGVSASSDWASLTLTGPAAARPAALAAVRQMPHFGSVHTVTYDCTGAGCAHSQPGGAGTGGSASPSPSGTPGSSSGSGAGLSAATAREKIQAILGARGVTFDFGGATLTPRDLALLRPVAAVLSQAPKVSVALSGYADNTGSDAVNVPLSRDRARAVENYLAAHGVSASRMTTAGLGSADPVATNSTSAGRAANRRVELTVQGN